LGDRAGRRERQLPATSTRLVVDRGGIAETWTDVHSARRTGGQATMATKRRLGLLLGAIGVAVCAALAPANAANAASTEGPPMKLKTVPAGLAANVGYDPGSTVNGEPVRQWWNRYADWNNQWIPIYINGGEYFTFRNRWSIQCMDIAGTSQGSTVVQQPCDDTYSQQWAIKPLNGHLRLVNRWATLIAGAERILTVWNVSQAGSVLVIWGNYGGADQQWDWSTP
jgi:hypothetical protein